MIVIVCSSVIKFSGMKHPHFAQNNLLETSWIRVISSVIPNIFSKQVTRALAHYINPFYRTFPLDTRNRAAEPPHMHAG